MPGPAVVTRDSHWREDRPHRAIMTPMDTTTSGSLAGQTVVVLGGSAGIGLETARQAVAAAR